MSTGNGNKFQPWTLKLPSKNVNIVHKCSIEKPGQAHINIWKAVITKDHSTRIQNQVPLRTWNKQGNERKQWMFDQLI